MCIGVQRNAVWPQARHLLQGAIEGLGALQGQAVNQIHIDRLHAMLSRGSNQGKDLGSVLYAVHGFLHGGVDILYAKAKPVKAHGGDGRNAGRIHRARIDFDRNLGTFGESEIFM